ncbi:MAG: TIGR02452 family protein [Pedosphaera sp.]|nr:TIGR02452 family protein [Pedosphaera sp.]
MKTANFWVQFDAYSEILRLQGRPNPWLETLIELLVMTSGEYRLSKSQWIDISALIEGSVRAKKSMSADSQLPWASGCKIFNTQIEVRRETTLEVAQRFIGETNQVLVLNFANGIQAGGGFLHRAATQEELLCRASGLYATLLGDPFYEYHRRQVAMESSDWVILSPKVPLFRGGNGALLRKPVLLDFVTCAAPFAPVVGLEKSAVLMRSRIGRVLAVAHAFEYLDIVLGAWGCGAFRNDSRRVAEEFKLALASDFRGVFRRWIFAIAE